MAKVGFIGAGKMGGAIIKGMISSGEYSPDDILVKGGNLRTVEELQKELGFKIAEIKDMIPEVDILVLAVKPNVTRAILNDLKNYDLQDKVVVSVAGNPRYAEYRDVLGNDVAIVRAMPNTPVEVLAGMTALYYDAKSQGKVAGVVDLFSAVGSVEVVADEILLTVASAVSGSSPAFVDLFIEAMADGAVHQGMPRNLAYKFATQAVLGASKLAQESGKTPAQLKDEVATPAGTTIEGLRVLERNGMRFAVMEAIIATIEEH